MNTQVTFTIYEVMQMLLWVCGAIISVAGATTIIVRAFQKAKEPEKQQDERISALEEKVEKHDKLFNNDNKRLIELEKGNRVTQQALLALLSHAINGNNDAELKEAKVKLENYLIGKGE